MGEVMTPTQEQIEAERAVGFRDGAEWADKNLVGPLLARVAELEAENERLKEVALTAAAEVGDKERHEAQVQRYILLAHVTIEDCARELEAAFAECNTLNLLHGAARLRALKNRPPTTEENLIEQMHARIAEIDAKYERLAIVRDDRLDMVYDPSSPTGYRVNPSPEAPEK